MFDIGFSELVLIGIVALLVIGPDRLPKVARTAGMWVGKMRGFVTSVKADIDHELAADELKKILKDQADSSGIHEIIEETKSVTDDIQKQDYVMRAINDDADTDTSDFDDDGSDLDSDLGPDLDSDVDKETKKNREDQR